MKSKILLILFIALTILGSAWSIEKYRSFDFDGADPTDQAYYPETYARMWTDGKLYADEYILNVFSQSGYAKDGSVHQTLHFEPIKYLIGFIYLLGGINTVLIFFCLAWFSPLLYGAWIIREKKSVLLWPMSRWDQVSSAIFAWLLCYAFLPVGFLTFTATMRPFILLMPFAVLLAMAVFFFRPWGEATITLILLLLAREEGIIIAGAILCFELLRKHRLVAFLALAAPLIGLAVLFTVHAGLPWTTLAYVLVGIVWLGALAEFDGNFRRGSTYILWYIVPVFFVNATLLDLEKHHEHHNYLSEAPWELKEETLRLTSEYVCGGHAMEITLVRPDEYMYTYFSTSTERLGSLENCRLLYVSHDAVLTDFTTSSLFYDYPEVYVYSNLPRPLVGSYPSFPRNMEDPEYLKNLRAIIRDRVGYAVLDDNYTGDILDVIKAAGMQAEKVDKVGRFTLYILR